MFKKTLISVAVASSLGLTGCFDSGDSGSNADPDYKISSPGFDGRTWPIFNPVTNELPLPNDLIFDSVASDGTFRVTDTTPPVTTALNSLSGASTVAPAVVSFNGQIDEDSVDARAFILTDPMDPSSVVPNPSQNVFLIELDYASGDPVQGLSNSEPPTIPLAVTATAAAGGDMGAGAELAALAQSPEYEAEVVELDGMSAIRINPLTPLDPRKRYVVVVTNEVLDVNGDPVIQSPSYNNITDTDQPLGSSNLASVRSIINGLWESIAASYFQVTNGARGSNALTVDDIAISYSFTTSNDEKVLQYIAEPQAWFADQLTSFIRVSAAKSVVENETDVNTDGTVDYTDVQLAADGAIAAFPDADTQAALDPLFSAAPPAGCQGTTGNTAIECIGVALASAPTSSGGFSNLLPTPQPRNVNAAAADAEDALSVSVSLSNFVDQGDVNIVQGTIDLPYYLATSGADLVTDSWQADSTLAGAMNGTFTDLGLAIPQADDTVTSAVNYIFPFPKKTTDVTVPMLVMYPSADPLDGTTPVVIFQHGITTDRSAALAFGTTLADTAGVAVVAIDQPLHGVAPFSTDDQLELAGTLLAASDASLNTETNRQAVVAGEFSTGLLAQIDPACAAIDVDFSDPSSVAAGKASVAGGACEGDVLDSTADMIGALGIESTVTRAGSTVPGLAATANERHFNFTANAANQPTPMVFDTDNPVGESGSLFINLTSLLTSRDNLRQGAVDLMNLRASIGNIDLDAAGGADFDASNVYFIGHSLGTVNGTPFVASVNENQVQFGGGKTSDDIVAANMLTPGGGIVRLLENSPTFAPEILGGLAAAAGLQQGDANLETYFNVFQATLDTVDPINFADNLVDQNNGILLSEIVGDTVVPNSAYPSTLGMAFEAPLAGTEPLATELGATDVTTGTVALAPAGITRYTAGSHETPVLPQGGTVAETAAATSVFIEMIGQAANLIGSGGAQTVVNDDSVVQQ